MMTLGDLQALLSRLESEWTPDTEIQVSAIGYAVKSTRPIMGHYESNDPADVPVIVLVCGESQ